MCNVGKAGKAGAASVAGEEDKTINDVGSRRAVTLHNITVDHVILYLFWPNLPLAPVRL